MVDDYESETERTVCERALLELGVFSIKLNGIERGYPDREFYIPGGKPLHIEFKRVGKEPTKYQLMIHARLRHAGYTVEVHDDVEEAMTAIRKAAKIKPAKPSKPEAPIGGTWNQLLKRRT